MRLQLVNETLVPNYRKPWRCQGQQVWPHHTSLGLDQVFSYERKSTISRSEMMKSILSISLEIVVFQESDTLLVDKAFQYVDPYGKKADRLRFGWI